MRVLVTGGTGFIGRRLVERLLQRQVSVKCLIHDYVGGLEELSVEIVRGDVTDRKSLQGIVDSAEQVYHLAAVGHVGANSALHRQWFHSVNVIGLQNLLDELREVRYTGRFVHFSSTAAMGLIHQTASEESACCPETPYQHSKFEAEQAVRQAHEQWGLPAVILRPSMVYGPGDKGSDFLSMCKLVAKGLFPIPRSTEALTPMVYVDDVVDAAILAGERGASGQVYIITSAKSYPIRELVKAISASLGVGRGGITLPESLLTFAGLACEQWARVTGSPPIMTRKRLKSFLADRTFDISRAVADLEYQPRTELQNGVARTVEWYQSTGRL